ncbi:TetR/AcrR family transcriptional regulator [Planctomonas psychrotolerans]|uniref:TetR/AcrR family transcriptional regulator n=1 Tax=Planctomonas psychrotolerans TaxID=2528712 RepID=UPI00123B5A4D|nr:TetR/AcrR family transcriptional regulator [Planctomonas psychrotolerans]
MSEPRGGASRDTYRHGDLQQALLDAGVELARDGGPHAVVLREATRRVGVSPNAAYRHFADHRALLEAVSDAAQGFVADAMEDELASATAAAERAVGTEDPAALAAELARAHLRAVGSGYLRFARSEPGLFRAAFSVPRVLDRADSSAKAGRGGRTPFQLLTIALDEHVEAGILPAERRAHTEFLAWSAVHGLATLMIDGPLRGLPHELVGGVERRLLDMVEQGL